MESVRAHEPSADTYVMVLDHPVASETRVDSHLYSVIDVNDLDLPSPAHFLFRYTILEANTAVKPWVMNYLSSALGYRSTIYLDPDIYLYRSLDHVHERLDRGASLVLIPHISGPIWDSQHPNETDLLKAGTYNLGFAAVGQWDVAKPVIEWWQQRLEYNCVVEPENGLFVDQKWMDLAPGLFDDVHILRHKGYNVAYWNLHERRITGTGTAWFADGCPLRFFHFSGLDITNPDQLSKHQTRFHLNDLGDAKALVLSYSGRLADNGAALFGNRPYGFAKTKDGFDIPDIVKRFYRRDQTFRHLCGDDPFSADLHALLNAVPSSDKYPPHLTQLMRWVWLDRQDLQMAFSDVDGADRLAYATWYVDEAKAQFDLCDALIKPARQQLAVVGAPTQPICQSFIVPDIVKMLTARDAQFIRRAYQVFLGREADATGERHFLEQLQQKRTSRRKILLALAFSPEGRRQGLRPLRLLSIIAPVSVLAFLASLRGPRNDSILGEQRVQETTSRFAHPFLTSRRLHAPSHNVRKDALRIMGYFEMDTGVSESARRCVAAAKTADMSIEHWNINPDQTLGQCHSEFSDSIAKASEQPATLIHVNADQLPLLNQQLDLADSGSAYRIGYWHWEMPLFPEKYFSAFSYVNEVWVPSTYMVEALLPVSPVPIVKIPHCIEIPVTSRNRFVHGRDLPSNSFLFLVMYDMKSYQERKNPIGSIEAYMRAFPAATGRHSLVIKVSDPDFDAHSFAQLKELAEARKDIFVLTDRMDRDTVYSLQASVDCLVSLHRSEGFGLCPAECMYLGKPVVATGWSGNMEFMNASNSYIVDYSLVSLTAPIGPYDAGQYWAEPDIDHAASLIRQVAEQDKERAQRGRAAARTMRERFSPHSIGLRYKRRLSDLAGFMDTCPTE